MVATCAPPSPCAATGPRGQHLPLNPFLPEVSTSEGNEDLNPKDITSSERNLEENFTDFWELPHIHEETLQEEAQMAAARAPGDLSGEVPMSPHGVWWVPRGGPGSSPGELGAGAELPREHRPSAALTAQAPAEDLEETSIREPQGSEPLICLLTQSTLSLV